MIYCTLWRADGQVSDRCRQKAPPKPKPLRAENVEKVLAFREVPGADGEPAVEEVFVKMRGETPFACCVTLDALLQHDWLS